MARKAIPINHNTLAAEICLMGEELNRLMELAYREGLGVSMAAKLRFQEGREDGLPQLHIAVLNRRRQS